MTCDTVWCVTWYYTGHYDLWSHINFIITQPPDNISFLNVSHTSAVKDENFLGNSLCLK